MPTLQEMMNSGFNQDLIKKAFPNLNVMPNGSFPSPGPARQPAESDEQAFAGNSKNAEVQLPPIDSNPNLPNDQQNDYMKMMLSQMALDPKYQAMSEQNIGEQQKGLKELQDYQGAIRGMPVQTDLSPTLALADSLTGSKLASSYTKPESGEQKIKTLEDLQKASQDQRNKITQDLTKLAQGKSAQGMLRNISQKQNIDLREATGAQVQFNKEQKDNVNRLNGATRIKKIFDDISNGSVAGNESAKSLALGEIRRLETGSGNSAFEGQKQLDQETGKQKLGELVQFMDAHPGSTVPPEIMNNIENMYRGLSSSYTDAFDSTTKGLLAGARPLQKQIWEAKHQALKGEFEKRLGGWGESLTGAPLKAPPNVPQDRWDKASTKDKKEFLEHMSTKNGG